MRSLADLGRSCPDAGGSRVIQQFAATSNAVEWTMDTFDSTSALQWHASPAELQNEPGMEHRWGRRRVCRAVVRLSGGSGVTGAGRLRNVSMSGAYIETSTRLPLFAPIELAMTREDGADAPVLLACVVRRDADGIGVEWAEVLPGPVCPILGCDLPCCSSPQPAGWEP
jgi:hypothetical protein